MLFRLAGLLHCNAPTFPRLLPQISFAASTSKSISKVDKVSRKKLPMSFDEYKRTNIKSLEIY